jgi:hypothetical protein
MFAVDWFIKRGGSFRLPKLPFIVKARFVSSVAEYVTPSFLPIAYSSARMQEKNQRGGWCCEAHCMKMYFGRRLLILLFSIFPSHSAHVT